MKTCLEELRMAKQLENVENLKGVLHHLLIL
ncbi:hypothetical protein POPTR_001G322001v4 [Populus trichocarpa]|uniref:Uncharacterized protein n=1 Tax=Populus trichocarpa TaxID=3694 RepID=A0ACC0TME7_POPTR|nr:hypothetical protein BDE02_01G286500 [Populus trichocarpa]KAI9402751.1 hypothetical protein POPTR_001G322001v4 [Populus trichocarpa]